MYPLKTSAKYDPSALASLSGIYTTVYLGNYIPGDFAEWHGSHPGVDIMPMTPHDTVVAVWDGTVFVAATSSMCGNHVVIKHEGIPDPDNVGQTMTYYSAYLHLSESCVQVGQVVREGDTIGKTGNTGNSFGEHLHFQIDSADAPFHVYWPFTTAEAKEAWYGFMDAVNHGIGREKARMYTANPLVLVDRVDALRASGTVVSTPISVVSVAPTVITTASDTVAIPVTDTVAPASSENISGFPDTPDDYPFAHAVKFVREKGIASGNNGHFFPDNHVTRAELVKMVLGAAGITPRFSDTKYFSDLDTNAWYVPYINTAKDQGILGGYDDGTFRPNNPVTRAEGCKIIVNTIRKDIVPHNALPAFSDVQMSDWFCPYASVARQYECMDFPNGQFEPNTPMTRGEVANTLYVLMK